MKSTILLLRWDPQQRVQFHCQILSNFLKIQNHKKQGKISTGGGISVVIWTDSVFIFNFITHIWNNASHWILFLSRNEKLLIGGLLKSFSKSVPPQGSLYFLLKIINHASKLKKNLVALSFRLLKSKLLLRDLVNILLS